MRRYSSRNAYSVGDSWEKRRRFQTIVILVLIVALAVSLVMLLPSASDRRNAHSFIVSRMLEECETAVSVTSRLSRGSSTSSYDSLARIRSSVYAIEVLNQAEQDATGSYLLPPETFTEIYGTLDTYNSQLIKGKQTGDQQTQLTGELDALHLRIEALQ